MLPHEIERVDAECFLLVGACQIAGVVATLHYGPKPTVFAPMLSRDSKTTMPFVILLANKAKIRWLRR